MSASNNGFTPFVGSTGLSDGGLLDVLFCQHTIARLNLHTM